MKNEQELLKTIDCYSLLMEEYQKDISELKTKILDIESNYIFYKLAKANLLEELRILRHKAGLNQDGSSD